VDIILYSVGETYVSMLLVCSFSSLSNTAVQRVATNVEVSDAESFPEDVFQVVEGTLEAFFDRIAPGENVTLSFVVVPTATYLLTPPPATVTFQVNDGSSATVLSSTKPVLRILSQREFKNNTPEVSEWLVFLALCLVPVVPPYLMLKSLRSRYVDGLPTGN
jgi:hypothetical protein